MSTRSPTQTHPYWGIFATYALLPNVAGSPTQSANLQVGDQAYLSDLRAFAVCVSAGLGAAVWSDNAGSTVVTPLFEDWISATAAGSTGWTSTSSGAGAGAAVNNATADNLHDGIVQQTTGTTAAGRNALSLGTNGIVSPVSPGVLSIESSVRWPTLSTVVEEYVSRLGMGDVVVAGANTNGFWFEYSRLASGNVFRCLTAAGGVVTTTVTATAIAAGTWYRLHAVLDPAAGNVKFYVDGVLVATHVANVPAGTAQRYAPNVKIQKSAGVTARTQLVDYYGYRLVLSGVR